MTDKLAPEELLDYTRGEVPTENPRSTHSNRANLALKAIEEAAGGRAAIVEQLHYAPESDKQQLLLGMLADPRCDTARLGVVCARAGVTVGQLLTWLRDGRKARALFEAMRRVEEGLPEVAGDVMARSVPHTLPCRGCDGTGGVTQRNVAKDGAVSWSRELCPSCLGKKVELHMPDLARQKVALEIGGLLQKGPVVQVVQQQANFSFGGQERRGLVHAADEVLYGGGREGQGSRRADVVDAEPAGEEPEDAP